MKSIEGRRSESQRAAELVQEAELAHEASICALIEALLAEGELVEGMDYPFSHANRVWSLRLSNKAKAEFAPPTP